MNRLERRKLQKKVKGGSLHVPKGIEVVNHDTDQWCHNHNLRLDDIENPTERDKKLIESVRLVPYKITEKSGTIKLGRTCPRCHRVFPLSEILTEAPTIDGFTTK